MFVITKFYKPYESFDGEEQQHQLASQKISRLLCRRKCSFCSTIRVMNSTCPPKPPTLTISVVIIAGLLFFLLIGFVIIKSLTHPSSPVLKLKLIEKNQNFFFVDNHSISAYEEAISVQTECAKLIGACEDSAFVFKGIPYASPPVGNLRWSRPVPIWKNSKLCNKHAYKRADTFGSICYQVNPNTKRYSGSEDCLYLNIWTPKIDDLGQLNVMVWIHGGFLHFGSGHQPGLSPSGKLAKRLNVVLVSFNYRLNAFGFLALSELASSGANTSFGNYGLWDQLTALEWVKNNIHAFGGNSQKITLFGADAGAASIIAHMTNPSSVGLFDSAWLIGPSVYFNQSFESASQHNHERFMSMTNCTNIDCLRKLSPNSITKMLLGKDDPFFRINDQNDLPIRGIFPLQLIVTDSEVVNDELPFNSKKSPIDIPLLVGTAAQSVQFWPGLNEIRNWTWNEFSKYTRLSLDSFNSELSDLAFKLYLWPSSEIKDKLNSDSSQSPELVYSNLVSDIRQNCPINNLLSVLTKNWKSNINRYVLTAQPSAPVRVYDYPSKYSFHLWEVIAFFDSIDHFVAHLSSEDLSFRDQVQKIVKNFIQKKTDQLWAAYPKSIALLSSNISIVSNYFQMRCDLWHNHGLDEYVWIS